MSRLRFSPCSALLTTDVIKVAATGEARVKEVRKTIVVAVLAVAFLDLEARLPLAHIVRWLMHWAGHPAILPG